MPRPRVKQGDAGAAVLLGATGAALGGLSRNPLAAVAGGLLGMALGASGTQPMGLEQAVAELVASTGLQFVSMSRRGPRGIDVAVRDAAAYEIIKVMAPESVTGAVQVDDFLYDELGRRLAERPRARTSDGG